MRDGPGWRALDLEEIEARPWGGRELTWLPLREAFGTRIVGIAAFTSPRPGQEVVEGHSEAEGGRAHEEIYVVLRGRAFFTLDGDELDAPTGTLVVVSDPRIHRWAVAGEPNTAVVALRGPADLRAVGV